MIRIDKGKSGKSLKTLASEHWDLLNPSDKGNYLPESIIEKITAASKNHLDNGRTDEANFYASLLANNNSLIKQLIVSHVSQFPALILTIENLLKSNNLWPLKSKDEKNIGHELLHSIMNYSSWRGSLGIRFYQNLNIDVCPYCNMGEIYFDENRGFLVCHFDHFYDKARYPYLSLSFYNLIPVCHQCNTPYKGTKQFVIDTHCHPYLDNYNAIVRFSSDFIRVDMPFKILLNYPINPFTRFQKFNNDMGIEVRYNLTNVKKYAGMVFGISQRYPTTAKNEWMKKLGKTLIEVEKTICSNEDLPYSEDEILNNKVGKLKRDLAFDYKVITT